MSNACLLSVRRGSLLFSGEVYDRYFATLENVVLLRDGADLLVMPVRQRAAGGYVIKLRSIAGDRAVQAADFFRDNGIADGDELQLVAHWMENRAALVITGLFN
ncbi:MAG: hypothetical protein NW217_08680 [Hyphomicrobiaceae bacterium]|nr:hypothetical protein [Hyphomicrobiaceae bacterium]